jgi:hypothetical protein
MRKPWKIVAHKSESKEYFIVGDAERMGAVTRLLKERPDLGQARIEFKGEAPEDFLDWLPDGDVFQVTVKS